VSPDTWNAALDRLEDDVHAGLALGLAGGAGDALGTWMPPAGLGPLPAELVDRARRIAAAQLEVSALLTGLQAETAKQRAAARSVPLAHDRAAAAYVDVVA
jgi:hypothetical protein